MKVVQLGEGDPEVAVLGGIHGDEPCGFEAVERLREAAPAVERPVKLVVANEEAQARGTRYVDEDLNRAFPGDPDADTHEGRLAARLSAELAGCTTLALHSTQSTAKPFALVNGVDDLARTVVPRLPVTAAVDTSGHVDGRIFASVRTVEVECGLQGSPEAAETAYRLSLAFLGALGALPDERRDPEEVPVFRLTRPIEKAPADAYEVYAENFERVEPEERFAAADGEALVASEPFYPVLLSPYGYADLFGYAAERTEVLS